MAINSYKQDEKLEEKSKTETLLRLFSYLLKYKLQIIVVLIMVGYGIVVSLINPIIMESAIDDYIGAKNPDFNGLLKLMGFAIVINLLVVLAVKIRMYIMAGVCNKILLTIRQELYTHIQSLDLKFFDSRPTGKIISRIIGDINSLKDVLSNAVTTLIPDFITIIAVLVIMFAKNPKLAAAALLGTPLMIAGTLFIEIKARPLWQVVRKKSSNLNAFVHEDLSGIRIIQSFNAEDETNATFEQLTKDHRSSFKKAVVYVDAFGSVIDFTWAIGSICLYFTGIVILGLDNVTLGTFLAFGTYMDMFWQPIRNISDFYNQLINNIAGAERIFEMLDTKPEITNLDGAEEMPLIKGNVKFDNVSFAYEGDTKILDGVNFEITEGETIALVGPTGAGKTTIVNLISRFYDTSNGSVLIDGQDVRNVTLESLRSQMGIMTQDNFLFTGTIRDNIRYGKLDATDEEIEAAAKAVSAHDFITKLPKGYDTVLSERGGGLSIGQRQLIAFARTMVSMPKILILDEATSSIDTGTEILVQKGIEQLLKGRTSFVIAHRLSTIKKADRIFVIDDGNIAEQGSPEDLMARKGAYYRLCMASAM